jgi:hypothetical protein
MFLARAFHLFNDLLDKYKELAGYKLFHAGAPQEDYDKLNKEIIEKQRQFNYVIGIGKPPELFECNRDLRIEVRNK